MPVIKAGPYDLDYTDTGRGPAVILLHSSASGLRQWRRLIDDLSPRYRVIAVNLFGYGATSRWPDERPATFADQADLVAAAASLAGEPVALVGHSLGGAVALETAARFADRVRLVVAFEPILFGHLEKHGPAAAWNEIAGIARGFDALARSGDWNAAGELFIDYWAVPGTWAAMSDARRANTMAMLPPIVHDWSMAVAGLRPLAGWGAITAPVHLLHAADTRAPTREIASLLAKTFPAWRAQEMSSGGHTAPLARPDLFNPIVADILDASPSRAAPA